MKNLATCKPTEFVAQTAKIKDAVANWMEVINFIGVRNNHPIYEIIPKDATIEQKGEILKRNAELKKKKAMENLSLLLDNMLVKHPQETLNVLALCCFIEPEHVDDYTMEEYFNCIMDMMENESVIRFFKLLAQLQMPQASI